MIKMGDKIMCKTSLSATLLIAMILTGLTFATAPETAVAQLGSDQVFARRMSSRVHRMQSEIKRLRQDVGEGNYANYGGISQQIDQLEEACTYYDRLLRNFGSANIGSTYERQRQRNNIEYTIRGMEQQLQALRKYVRQIDEEKADAEEERAEEEALEEELSEDDWAEDWAKGKD
jgi:hypothetical protein